MTRLVDTHCHLQHAHFDADRNDVLTRALHELDWLVVIGDDVASSADGCRLASQHAGRVFATAGIHPHHAAKVDLESLDDIRRILTDPSVVALGEIGLDYYYDFAPRPRQRDLFRAQLDLAAETGKPVVIHSRDAGDDTAGIIEPFIGRLAGGVMHCFGGDASFARQCLAWGFYISFAGNVTFPKAIPLQDAAAIVPLDRLLLETDSPYLAPQPVRGKRCEPVHVIHIARFVASLKNADFDTLVEATSDNARRFFRVPSTQPGTPPPA